MLTGENLSKSYGGRKIIDQVSTKLEPGKISVVIGPSGSGKTTLIKLLSLLELPDTGEINVDDRKYQFPVKGGKLEDPPWPLLTVVFQQLFLWPHLTLLQNMTLPISARGIELKQEKVDELISLFNMEEFIHRFPNETSGGQRQRVALARALLLEPKYILLDEVTSSLDVEQVAVILTHLKDLATKGIGIMTVTHLLHFAQEAADNIIFMDGGKVLESGGKEVLTSPKHERIQSFLSLIQSAT